MCEYSEDFIGNFIGKRNTCLSIFIPPKRNINKLFEPILRQIKAIRHANKRGQSLKVINCLIDKCKLNYEQYLLGLIICGGLGNDNKVHHEIIKPNCEIKEFVYEYGDVFNIDLVRCYIYPNKIKFINSAKIAADKIKKSIMSEEKLFVVGDDLKDGIENNLIKCIYYFGDKFIPKDILGFDIYKFRYDDLDRINMQKDFGDVVGELFYSN